MNYDFYLFSGTHWDREWYQPFQGFRLNLVKTIDDLIEHLESSQYPQVFHLDGQTIVLEDYIEIKPQNTQRLKKLISDGRIAIGPWYCMPDEFLVSGEALIRNLQKGIALCNEWGVDYWRVGYICDVFGHIAQMPQIFKGFGINYAVLGRGTNEHTTPPFFVWVAPSGSKVLTFKLPDKSGYGTFAMEVCGQITHDEMINTDSDEFEIKAKDYVEHEKSRANIPVLILMDAMDHEPVHKKTKMYLDKLTAMYPDDSFSNGNMLEAFNKAEKYLEEIPKKAGELNETAKQEGKYLHLLTNTLSSRHSIKAENDICQALLEKRLEPLLVLLESEGIAYEKQYIDIAWKYLLQNHPHDSICGCSLDIVHIDMFYRFSQVHSICEAIFNDAIRSLSGGFKLIDGRNEYICVINTLAHAREELITVEIPFSPDYPKWHEPFGYQSLCCFKIYDDSGCEIPYAILDIHSNADIRLIADKLAKADIYKITFRARLNALGFTSFKIENQSKPVRYGNGTVKSDCSLENEKLRITLNDDGTINILRKDNGKVYQNLLGFIDDGEIGDGWNSTRPATDYVSTKTKLVSAAITSNTAEYGEITVVRELPVSQQMRYGETGINREEPIIALKSHFTISLAKNSELVNIALTIENNVRDHRLRLMLPNGLKGGKYTVNQAFSFVERECGADETTYDWKEKSPLEKATSGIVLKRDDRDLFAFISRHGIHECGVDNDEKNTISLTLLRGFSKIYTTNGSSGGQELGAHTYKFALLVTGADTPNEAVQQIQDAIMSDPLVFVSSKPRNHSLFEAGKNLCISAIKPDYLGNIVVRLYNPSTESRTLRLNPMAYKGAAKCDLLEKETENIDFEKGTELEIMPYEITTLKLFK